MRFPTALSRRRCHAIAVGFTAALLVLVGSTPAFAHATLETVAPANESLVESMPSEVVLRFDEQVSLDLGAGIRVFGPGGQRVDRSVSRLRDLEKSVAVSIDDGGAGTYTVAWRVVSEDAHVLRGSSVFHVRTKTGAVDTSVQSSGGQSLLGWAARFLVLASATVLLGAAVFVMAIGLDPRDSLRTLMRLGGALLVLGSVVRFAVQVALASGRGVFDAVGLWGEAVSSTRPGSLDAFRIAAAVVAVLGAFIWSQRIGPKLVAVGAFGSVAANSLGGHAWTAASSGSTVAADVVHQGAAAAWAGGVLALYLVLRIRDDRRAECAGAFERIAVTSAGLLFATGVWASYVQVGSVASFTSTGYGRMVLVKLAGFGLMAVLGWINRARLRTALTAAKRTFWSELFVAGVVLAVTASLIGSVPAKTGSREPFYTRIETASMGIDVTVLPATVGLNTLHLYFYDATGSPDNVDVATASIAIRDIPPRKIQLLPITGDHFSAAGFALPMKGVWTLTLNTIRKGNAESFTLEVPVK